MFEIKNYIDGQFCKPTIGKKLKNLEPATGQVYGTLPNSTTKDLQLAIASAEKAQPGWGGIVDG